MKIREIKENKGTLCEGILRSLPEWFGIEDAIINYRNEINKMLTFGCYDNNNLNGFITINFHNEYTAEIHVMGILREFHSKGIGTELIRYCESILKNKKIEYLQVKTLAETNPDPNYALTRKFYLKNNFRPVEIFPELWDKNNPCLLLIKKLD